MRMPYISALLECLDKRFPDMPVLSALGIFTASTFPRKSQGVGALAAFSNKEMYVLLDIFGTEHCVNKTLIPPLVNAEETKVEWVQLKSLVAKDNNLRLCRDMQQFVHTLHEQ